MWSLFWQWDLQSIFYKIKGLPSQVQRPHNLFQQCDLMKKYIYITHIFNFKATTLNETQPNDFMKYHIT